MYVRFSPTTVHKFTRILSRWNFEEDLDPWVKSTRVDASVRRKAARSHSHKSRVTKSVKPKPARVRIFDVAPTYNAARDASSGGGLHVAGAHVAPERQKEWRVGPSLVDIRTESPCPMLDCDGTGNTNGVSLIHMVRYMLLKDNLVCVCEYV